MSLSFYLHTRVHVHPHAGKHTQLKHNLDACVHICTHPNATADARTCAHLHRYRRRLAAFTTISVSTVPNTVASVAVTAITASTAPAVMTTPSTSAHTTTKGVNDAQI